VYGSAAPPRVSSDELAERISRIAPAARATLEVVVQRARSLELPIAWVGGGVRDLFLERRHPDLDLVVEADPAPLARTVAAVLGGKMRLHGRFATASIASDRVRIDLARARRETYAEPAALPVVAPAPLEEDLGRRDFALNAMAVRFATEPDGPLELLDPHGGLRDLRRGTLRVLHARSLEDDPTRILRGVGFELRFGYRLDPESERLAKTAAEHGVLERLSGERRRRALRRAFEEPAKVAPALRRLRDLGALGHLLPPGFDVDGAIDRSVAILEAGAPLEPDAATAFELFLIAVGAGLSHPDRQDLGQRLSLPARQTEILLEAPEKIAEACRRIRGTLRPHEVSETLAAMSAVEIAAAVALGGEPVAGWVARWRSELRARVSALRASDLLAAGVPPGPAIGVGLRAARRARIDRGIGPEEELAVALAAVREGSS